MAKDCTVPGLRTGLAVLDEALERARRELNINDPGGSFSFGSFLFCFQKGFLKGRRPYHVPLFERLFKGKMGKW